LTLDESKNENDMVSESEGVKVVYDSELEDYLNGSVVNYSESWFNRGFTIGGGNLSSC
jgi:Fe-S cluster assembly iron-binding protein IscA